MQTSDDLVQHTVCSVFDLLLCPILDRMVYVNGIEVGPPESRCLRSCRQSEFMRGDGHCWYAPIFELDRVVQTARCA